MDQVGTRMETIENIIKNHFGCREDEIGRGKVRWSYGIYMTVREGR